MLSVFKRNAVYYFRLRVPSDIRKYFPSAEIVRSLHTHLYRNARSLAACKLGELEKLFMAIRSNTLSEAAILKMTTEYLSDGVSRFEEARLLMSPSDEDHEAIHAYKEKLILKNMERLGKGRASKSSTITHNVDLALLRNQIDISKDTPDYKLLCDRFLKTEIELNKIIIEHLKGNYETDYDNRGKDHRLGGTLKELLYLYHQENESKWKDAASIKAIHNRILHMLGDVPLDEIDRQRCVQFRNDLKEYPLRNRDFNTPWRKLSEKKLSRLSERTQNGTMTELSTLLNYAVSAFGIKSNPASGLAKSKSECKPQKTREEYSKIELNKMVKLLAEVNRAKKPEVFWIPLLLLYTGARSNEICGLRCDDISDGVIHIRNRPEYNQRTKNTKDRQVPIHAALLDLGFDDFCKAQMNLGYDRIFPALKLSAGKWNVNYGKQFNRSFKTKFLVGYTKEQLAAKDLHTFRKTFIFWFVKSGKIDNLIQLATLQSIVGHVEAVELGSLQASLQSSQLTIEGYGGGFVVDQESLIKQLDYDVDLSPLLTK